MAGFGHRFREYRPTKTALFWSGVGSIIVALILGFTWGGWVTGATARQMAEDAARKAQAELAASVCVDRFLKAADARAQLASLKDIDNSWRQENFIKEGGWAKIAGTGYEDAAELCAETLIEKEPPTAQEGAQATGETIVQ